MSKKKIQFLGVSSGICAPTAKGRGGAELGFDAIRSFALKSESMVFIENPTKHIVSTNYLYENYLNTPENIEAFKKDIKKLKEGDENDRFARHIKYLKQIFSIIKNDLNKSLHDGFLPFIIAGDHSTAAASIAGVKTYLQEVAEKNNHKQTARLGVIWIDAHVDAHCPFSTPSGNMHGMPLGVALNIKEDLTKRKKKPVYGRVLPPEVQSDWDELCFLHTPKEENRRMLEEKELVFIGIRSWEKHEESLLIGDKKKNREPIKHFKLTRRKEGKDPNDAKKRKNEEFDRIGLKDKYHIRNSSLMKVCTDTVEYLKKNGCSNIYISFDIDVLDSSIVPGTGTRVPYGLAIDEVRFLLDYFWHQKELPLLAIELVEVNPLLDHGNKTSKVALDIIESLLKSHASS